MPISIVLNGFLAVLLSLVSLSAASAQAIETKAREAIIVDLGSGRVLLDKNADQRMPTASMSKLGTMYMVFEAVDEGRLSLEQTLPVSEKAWRKGGSKMFVEVGSMVAVQDLMRGVIIQSGNDATIVLAEGLAGTEDAFADAMTRRLREIGLENTQFQNASGWPDPEHYSTARDLSKLAIELIERFPQFYPIYSERDFTFSGIKQGNRNPLLYRNIGADGLKTGHTSEAGYGLVASAERDNRRLVMVVNGLESVQDRADESAKLIEWAFANYDVYDLFGANPDATVHDLPVWLGESPTVGLKLAEPVTLALNREERRNLNMRFELESPITAPVSAGQQVGALLIDAPDGTRSIPLLAQSDVPKLGFSGRVEAALTHILFGSSAQ
ncbi:MAG: D-alanyl-D-alanine carboxypeptidase [Alphaproteobacteria bacterium]|nr:D-alanyl-D-alanine carboxypeptidase [Alphaproteobacteria bacterium SS10]